MEDKTIQCRECNRSFVWTIGEQEFFQQKGFSNAPTRCPDCRKARRTPKQFSPQTHAIRCASCGKEDQVPFEPRDPSAILCAECFDKKRKEEKEKKEPDIKNKEVQANKAETPPKDIKKI